MQCPIYNKELQKYDFTFFDFNKKRELYNTYKCSFDHLIEILQDIESIDKQGDAKDMK